MFCRFNRVLKRSGPYLCIMSKKNKKTKPQNIAMDAATYIKTGRARNLPVYKCYVNNDWQEEGLASILVTRKHINGNLTSAFFLVDLFCVGVKDSFYHFNEEESFLEEILDHHRDIGMDLQECDYLLAHNIIYSAVDFAGQYGIKPVKEFEISEKVLAEDDDSIELMEIECGKNGRPYLILNPADPNSRYYFSQLRTHAGSGNFDVELIDDEYDDDEEEDTNYDESEELYNDNLFMTAARAWTEDDWTTFFEDQDNIEQIKNSPDLILLIYRKLIFNFQTELSPKHDDDLSALNFTKVDNDIEDEEKDNEISEITDLYDEFSLGEKKLINTIKKRCADAIAKWPEERDFYILLHNALFDFDMKGTGAERDEVCKSIYASLPNDIIANSMYGLSLLRNGRENEMPLLSRVKNIPNEILQPAFTRIETIAFSTLMCTYFLQKNDIQLAAAYGDVITNQEIFDNLELRSTCVEKVAELVEEQVIDLITGLFDDMSKWKEAIKTLLA